ncbi:MAG: glycosyltransferase family 1 protein [Henriciella sp.]
MAETFWDVLILTDPRFMGGTSAAIATDVRAFQAMGLKTAIHFIDANGFFLPEETANPVFDELFALGGVEKIETSSARARLAFFHHPAIFLNECSAPLRILADKAIIVTHQPLFAGNGGLNIDPIRVQNNIQRQFGPKPDWAPISGLCRSQYLSFAPFLRLTNIDWINTFAVEDWKPKREKLTGPMLTVGRHGRPHKDKWPDTGDDLTASLPAGPQTHIRVLGADPEFYSGYGVDISAWEILPFNAEPAADYLDSLDVFSYFHSSEWTEAFGRTIAEAMLMKTRCILDPALKPTFGEHAIYCQPTEVSNVLEHIRADLPAAKKAAEAARDFCVTAYSTSTIAARYHAMLADSGTTSRRGEIAVAPWTSLRRLAGFHRRQRAYKNRVTA